MAVQAPVLGPFSEAMQAYQYTFSETVAGTYELAGAYGGFGNWHLSGSKPRVVVTPAAALPAFCSVAFNANSSGAAVPAGQPVSLVLSGSDAYGAALFACAHVHKPHACMRACMQRSATSCM
jgi:hypothetical protein